MGVINWGDVTLFVLQAPHNEQHYQTLGLQTYKLDYEHCINLTLKYGQPGNCCQALALYATSLYTIAQCMWVTHFISLTNNIRQSFSIPGWFTNSLLDENRDSPPVWTLQKKKKKKTIKEFALPSLALGHAKSYGLSGRTSFGVFPGLDSASLLIPP